ncbi:MAG: hypothetical protein V4704_06625 [Pseudomonadota bacterium]
MSCMPFRLTAVLAALLAATACTEQDAGSTIAPPPAAREQADVSTPSAQPPSLPVQPAGQGVDPAMPASTPAPGNPAPSATRPPPQSMPVPEELYPVDPAPTPPPER